MPGGWGAAHARAKAHRSSIVENMPNLVSKNQRVARYPTHYTLVCSGSKIKSNTEILNMFNRKRPNTGVKLKCCYILQSWTSTSKDGNVRYFTSCKKVKFAYQKFLLTKTLQILRTGSCFDQWMYSCNQFLDRAQMSLQSLHQYTSRQVRCAFISSA